MLTKEVREVMAACAEKYPEGFANTYIVQLDEYGEPDLVIENARDAAETIMNDPSLVRFG